MKSLNAFRQNSAGGALGSLRRVFLAGGLMLCTAALATAGTLKGTVTNGTTKRPVANAEVVLMELQTGMQPVGKVKTDAHGHFQFTNDAAGKEPMLLQATYRGVSYYKSVEAGETTATIEVYDSSSDPKSIMVDSRAIIVRNNGANLDIEEQYIVDNLTEPPVAFYMPKGPGTFTFQVPDGAQLGRVLAWTGKRLPTLQKTVDAPNHRKAIDWAFRPGKSVVRISYVLPYPSNQAIIRTQSPYPVTHVFLAAPPGIQLKSDGFKMIGTEQGYNIYGRQQVATETALLISVSGVASAGAPGAQSASGDASDAGIATLPDRYRNLTWIIAICGAMILFMATMYFWRKSAAQQALATASGPGNAPKGNRERKRPAAESSASPDIDHIKDQLFQLELRRQAGTLSEEDYTRERQEVEETLRSLMKG